MAKKTYRKFSKKGLSKKNKLRKSKRKYLRSKRKSRKHGGILQGAFDGHYPCIPGLTQNGKFQYFLCELAKYYYYKMNKDTTREETHKQKLINMGIPQDKLDQFYKEVTKEDTAEVTAEDTAEVTADTIKEKLYDTLVIKNNLTKILGPTPYTGIRGDIWDARERIVFGG